MPVQGPKCFFYVFYATCVQFGIVVRRDAAAATTQASYIHDVQYMHTYTPATYIHKCGAVAYSNPSKLAQSPLESASIRLSSER